MRLVVTVDDALRFPDAGVPTKFVMDLKGVLTYDNPDYWKAHAQGFYTGNIPRKITTFELNAGMVRVSRGAMGKLREVAAAHGIEVRTADRRVSVPVDGLKSDIVLRTYQQPAVDAILKREQGIVRGPCGCGKTILLLKAIEMVKQQALVVVWNRSPLMDQWVDHVHEHFGFDPGVIGGGHKPRIAPITIGMQQTLCRNPTDWVKYFGAVFVDETHRAGSRTYQDAINVFPAKIRIGASADEKRRDHKDFLVYDTMGELIHEIREEELVEGGVAMPVRVRIVPTGFAHRYGTSVVMADGTIVKNRNYTDLIGDMTRDEQRNRLILQDVLAEMAAGHRGLLLTDRVLAVEFWLRELRARGIAASAMVGGAQNRDETDRARTGMLQGEVQMVVGTTSLCREALDIPCLDRMFITSPVGDTKKLVQMVGRLKRVFDGKTGAECYYYLDEKIFTGTRNRIERLFKGLTEYRPPVVGPQVESLPFPEERSDK